MSIEMALKQDGGARFYRCAFHVNPYAYAVRQGVKMAAASEEAYNEAMVKGLTSAGVEAIAIADHYRVRDSESLRRAAEGSGVKVFPAFEAVTKEGVHVLCLFDVGTPTDYIERRIGECGVVEDGTASPLGKHDFTELLELATGWGAVCIAAHAVSEGGLLKVLKGQPRIAAWKHPDLMAASFAGPADSLPDEFRAIVTGKDATYRRDFRIAHVNAQDVRSPEDAGKAGTVTLVKMSQPTVAGLRQAFLDPMSRVRLLSEEAPPEHTELLAVAWEGGFLDGIALRLNGNLNVFVGGRGTGKSTVVESIRYVLDLEPAGDEAGKSHASMVKNVLKPGTKISLAVRSHKPDQRTYVVERLVPGKPVVRDEGGNVVPVIPRELFAGIEIYGQHEISELAREPARLTRLLDRFVRRDSSAVQRRRELQEELETTRDALLRVEKQLQDAQGRLAGLPGVEETLKRFEAAGVEVKLKDRSTLVTEEAILDGAKQKLAALDKVLKTAEQGLTIDQSTFSQDKLKDLPRAAMLAEAGEVLSTAEAGVRAGVANARLAASTAAESLNALRARWEVEKQRVETETAQALRDLQKDKVDASEFIRLRKEAEELRALKVSATALEVDRAKALQDRSNAMVAWEDFKAVRFRELQQAARKVSKELERRIRVTVEFERDRGPLAEALKANVAGRLSESIDKLSTRPTLSLSEFAQACRAGAAELETKFGLPAAQASRICALGGEACLSIEELELPHVTNIELNVAAEGADPVWKPLDALSTGQKATAVLLLTLLESDAPLVIDQPEDDLDNRFITEGIVPQMRLEKRRRQFVFSTHNANIPVLGDAELIVGLSAVGEPGAGRAEVRAEHVGSIDKEPVADLVTSLLEGGQTAFETRRRKYGF